MTTDKSTRNTTNGSPESSSMPFTGRETVGWPVRSVANPRTDERTSGPPTIVSAIDGAKGST